MDQESFEAGVLLGLRTAAVVTRPISGPATQAIDTERMDLEELIAQRRGGHRMMVEGDILLPMPLMTAADIGWPSLHNREGGSGG